MDNGLFTEMKLERQKSLTLSAFSFKDILTYMTDLILRFLHSLNLWSVGHNTVPFALVFFKLLFIERLQMFSS